MSLSQKKNKTLAVITFFVGISYPFIVYFGLCVSPPKTIAFCLIALLLLRLIWGKIEKKNNLELFVFAGAVVLTLVLLPLNEMLAIKIYPLTISFGLAVVFSYSILRPPTIIERIARRMAPNLNERGVRYTRQVTKAWVIFFIVNGAISAWTAIYANIDVWLLYNGFISYILMGLLFSLEFLMRQTVKKHHFLR
jgi:uncharacterized membrane protein